MKILLPVLGAGAALLALVGLARAKSSNPEIPPSDALPPSTNTGKPVFTLSRAGSGRSYQTWMWPPTASGIWTVVRLVGSTAFMAFERLNDQNVPRKTNVTDPQLLGLMRQDWQM